jgi:secondary thiamine-phosphate synthase enzyme
MFGQLTIKTSQKTQVLDVTQEAKSLISGKVDGIAFFYLPHTTATLLMCEDDEELRKDIIRTAERWLQDCGPFLHIRKNNPNAAAHILSAFGGHGVPIAIKGGQLDFGTYQNLLLLELDGPKERELRCCVVTSGKPQD